MYSDTITHEEMADISPTPEERLLVQHPHQFALKRLVRDRVASLLKRSGANNVVNWRLRQWEDPHAMVLRMAVSFDSSAWTGR